MYGKVAQSPQDEKTPFYPRSPYGCAKVYSYWITKNYREAYNLFAVNGILFNHESSRRGENFVTRKITKNLAEIKVGLKKTPLLLGNLEAKRDWGYSRDFVEAMWLMMQQDEADDYVVATGETHTVREFVEEVAKNLGMEIEWVGAGLNEYAVNKKTNNVIIKIDQKHFRPTEVDLLLGNPKKAMEKLGWKPKVTFKELAKLMTEEDLKKAMGEKVKKDSGF
jgi:GDPmannose 4,6-dehydratase